MRKIRSEIVPALLVLLLLNSCVKKGNTGPAGATGPAGSAGPAGPAFTGAINGHVSLYDQYGTRTFTGLNNVQLGLKNGTPATADANGYYVFGGLSTGDYTITASAPGFATTMVNNLPFISDTVYRDVKLSQKPVFNINSFKAYHNAGSLYDSLVLGVDPDTKVRNCIVFVGKNAGVNNLPANYLLSYTKSVLWGPLVIMVPAADLNGAGIYFGEEVHYAAYSYVVNDASVYEDPVTGRNVYNAVGNSLSDSTTCP